MKKILLFIVLCPAGLSCFSQSHPIPFPDELLGRALIAKIPPKDEPMGIRDIVYPAVQTPILTTDEYEVGNSYYDLQSNYTVSGRIYYYPEDNTISTVWARGMTEMGNFPDRGTAYNYFDGTSWQDSPTERIENEKAGWPTIAPWGENGEIVVAHFNDRLSIARRPQKGSGEWEFFDLDGPAGTELSWPRMCTSGVTHDTVHIIVSSYNPYMGQDNAILYYRSPNGGETWDIEAEILEGMGSEYYLQLFNDVYAWAHPRGNTIAFVVGFEWADMFVMKSTDAGDTWEKILVWENPYPGFDFGSTITDTFFAVDNSCAIALDYQDKVHVTFGITRVLHDSPGDTWTVFYMYDGIGYWNEDMEPFSGDIDALSPPQYEYEYTEMVEDYNYIGWTQDVNDNGEIDFLEEVFHNYGGSGISTMPTMTIDDQDRLFLAFASTTEGYTNAQYNYKHIWARAYDPAEGWSQFIDLNDNIVHIFDECFYPVFAGLSDGYLHLLYNADQTPGIAMNDDHVFQENRIIYSRINKFEFFPQDIPDIEEQASQVHVSQNYPNPVYNLSGVHIELPRDSYLRLEVFNLAGQLQTAYDQGYVRKGTHIITIRVENLAPGVYFYTVDTGTEKITKKMIVM